MNNTGLHDRSVLVKQMALDSGFDSCGISRADYLDNEASRLENWLNQNRHGEMGYMARNKDKRLDPSKLVEGAKSVISLIHNYFPKEDIFKNKKFKISKYAFGKDYHEVIKKKLNIFLSCLKGNFGVVNGRVFVDSAPVMERQWAARAGLGWTGKNTLLLNKTIGSFFFLAEAIIDIELEPDTPIKDFCGSCTKCIDACPTQALTPYQLDARKCISYLTIELKESIPLKFKNKYESWIFGCDICQDVCPWNRFSTPHNEPDFAPNSELKEMTESNWKEITQDDFNSLFNKSAVKRTKYKGLKRNISFLNKSD